MAIPNLNPAPQHTILLLCYWTESQVMRCIDIISFCLSVVGIYSLLFYFRYLLPRNAIPLLFALLNDTRQLLDHAEEIGAVSPHGECRTRLDRSADQFAAMRIESNHARGTFQQLRLVYLRALSCRLCSLYHQIEAIKMDLELAVDKERLSITENAASTAVPSLTTVPSLAVTATPLSSVVEQTLPMPATTSGMPIAASAS